MCKKVKLLLLGAVIAVFAVPALRNKVLDQLFGSEEEFKYSGPDGGRSRAGRGPERLEHFRQHPSPAMRGDRAGARHRRGVARLLPGSRRARVAVCSAAGVLLVLVAAQLVLPALAAREIRHRLGKGADITSISVSAFPAIELLWERVGTLKLEMKRYDTSLHQIFGQIKQSGEVAALNVSIGTLSVPPLTLRDVELHKRDGQLTLNARLLTSDLQRALPLIQSLTPVQSGGGQLSLRGTASLLGSSVSVTATITTEGGKVVVSPEGLLGAFATVTVFNNPNLYVESVSGHAIAGGLLISARAAYR